MMSKKENKMKNDKMGIHNTQRLDNPGSNEPLRGRGMADNVDRPQDNYIRPTYCDGFVDHVHEI